MAFIVDDEESAAEDNMVRSYEEMEASVLTAESHLIAALAEEVASEQGRFVSAFTAELGSKSLEHLEIGPVAQLMLGPQA